MATLANQSQANLQSFGQGGFNVVTDANPHTGDYSAITVAEEAVFSSITGGNVRLNGLASSDALDGVTLAAGITIFGKISGFTLASGKVIAYYAV